MCILCGGLFLSPTCSIVVERQADKRDEQPQEFSCYFDIHLLRRHFLKNAGTILLVENFIDPGSGHNQPSNAQNQGYNDQWLAEFVEER